MEDLEVLHSFLFEQGIEKDDLPAFKAKMADPILQEELHGLMQEVYEDKRDLATFKGMFIPEKKKDSLPVSQPQSKTASVATPKPITIEGSNEPIPFGEAKKPEVVLADSEAPVVSQPPVAKLGTPEAMLEANEQLEQGADDVRRSKAIAETMFGISRLAQTKGIDESFVKNSLGKIMADESKPNELRDVLALREAYKVFNNAGVSRGGGEFTEGVHSGDDMLKVWEHLSKAEANLRQKNPVEWNKFIQQSKESHYEKLGASEARYVTPGDKLLKEKVADKQLIASAIDNGVTGLEGRSYQDIGGKLVTEADEAKLRNEMSNLELKLDIANKSGDPKLISLAQTEYNRMKTEADRIRTIRHKSITDQIAQAKTALDRTDLPEMARAAGQQILKDLENEERGFIDPTYQFGKVLAENKEEIAEASDPTDSPQVAMRKYLGNLLFEKKVLDERLNNESMAAGISREVTGLTIRGWNDDERRSKELENKIKSVSRVVLLNELPETSGAMNAGGGSFVDTLWGSSTMGKLLDTNTTQGRALDTQEMFDAVGLDPQMLNPEYSKRFETRKEGPGWLSFEHLASLGGMVAAMGLQAEAGGGAMKGLGIDKVFGQMRALPKGTPGAKFANVVTRSLEKGAQYELTGDLFKDQEHFFNIATGIAGGAAEGVVSNVLGAVGKGLVTGNEKVVLPAAESIAAFGKGASKKMARMWVNTFGNKSGEATKWLLANGQTLQQATTGAAVATAERFARGTGSVVGQFAEGNIRNLQGIGDAGDDAVVFSDMADAFDGLVKIFQDSDVRAEYRKGLEEQFGATPSERAGFFADMFVMGFMLGGHSKGLGNKARERASEIYSEMTDPERAYADEVVRGAEEMDAARQEAISRWEEEGGRQVGVAEEVTTEPAKEGVAEVVAEEPVVEVGTTTPEPVVEPVAPPTPPSFYEQPEVKAANEAIKNIERTYVVNRSIPEYQNMTNEQLTREWAGKMKAEKEAELADPTTRGAKRANAERELAKMDMILDGLDKLANPPEMTLAEELAEIKRQRDKEVSDAVLKNGIGDGSEIKAIESRFEAMEAEANKRHAEKTPAEPEVVAVIEPTVEPTKPGTKATLEETVADIEQRRQDALDALGNDGVTIQQTRAIREKYDAEVQAAKDHFGEPEVVAATTEPVVKPKPMTVAEEIKATMEMMAQGVRDGLGENALEKIEQYSDEIVKDPTKREKVIDGLKPTWVEAIDKMVEAKQKLAEANVEAVPEPVAEPVLEVGVQPTAETGSGVPPEPPVNNQAAGGGGIPPVPPPIEVATTATPEPTGGNTPPPVSGTDPNTTGGGPMKERATPKTYSKYVDEGAMKDMLDRAEKFYRSQTQKDLYKRAMNLLTGGTEEIDPDTGVSKWSWELDENGEPIKQSPFEMVDDLTSGKARPIGDFADVLAQRQVLAKLTSDAMDVVVKKLQTTTDPVEKAQMEADLARFGEMRDKLGESIFQQGTIGGQGISFIGHFRDMYENPEAMIWNEIAKHNKARAEAVKEKSKEIANGLSETRDKVGQEVANQVANSATVNGIAEQSAGTAAKKKAASSKATIAKERAKRQESVSKLKDLLKGPEKGKALDITTIAAELIGRGGEALLELGKIGVSLANEGAVRFVDWAQKMRDELAGVVEFTDKDLEQVFAMDVEGQSAKAVAELELRKAAIAPKENAAKEKSLRKQIQDEFQKGDKDLKSRLEKEVGLSPAEADFVIKEGKAVIEKSTKKLNDKRVELEKKAIEAEEKAQQKAIERQAAKAEQDRRKELERQVNSAVTEFYKDPNGKTVEERLADSGLDPVQIQEVMDARASEFAQGAIDAITKAAKEPLPKTKAGEPSLRKKIQDAFNAHFNPKNAGSGIPLKERLVKEAGLTEAQADLVLSEEQQQLSKREQKLIDDVIAREQLRAQKDYEQQVRDEAIQEQRDLKNNVKSAISEHFGKDNIKNKVESKLAQDAGLPDPAIDKITKKSTGTAPAIGSTISENGFDYELKSVSADGKTLKYERVIPEAEATTRKEIADIARKAATFGKMRLLDGKTLGREELKKKVAEATGLKGDALDQVVDLMQKEANMSFTDRIEEKTGLPRAEAEKIAAEASKEFEARAKQHVEAKVKGLKSKPARDQVHRPTTDVDRALNALMDGELTTDMVNDIFKDRFGFKDQMTPEQATRMRDLAKALARTAPGSQLELDAARKLDLAFDHFLPDVSAWSKAGEYWKAWAYANMLNGISTSAVNIISSSGYILAAPALNIASPSEWVFAVRNAINAEGGGKTKLNTFARSSPIAAAAVKYVAGLKGIKQARRRASDIFYEGYIDNKFLGQGKQALGRQMNILERRASTFKGAAGLAGKYSALLKYSARNLAAQDVFIRTVAHEMQLADAVRRADVFLKRGDMAAMGFDKKQMEAAGYNLPALRSFSYPQWVNYQLSMNNPNYKGAIEIAIQDVQAHEQLTGGLTDAQRKRYVETRAKEVIRFGGENELTGEKIPGLRLSEKEFEDAEAIARSQIFTHQRGGVHSKWSGALAKMTSNKAAGKLLWPLIPFTTIIGNLSDTMADFNPVTGIARANGISMSELIAEFQRYNQKSAKNKEPKPVLSAKMGDQFPKANSFGEFVDMRVKRAFETKDSKYYEQMARAWTGIQALTALALTTSSNPYQGFGLTGSQDDKNPYMIMIDGKPVMSYKDIPAIGPAAAIVAKWHEYARENPDKKDAEFYEDRAARLWYALGTAETLPGKVSVAEGSIRAMDIFSGLLEMGMAKQRKGQDSPDYGKMGKDLIAEVARPYLSVLTKPLPQRASTLEQIEQIFDPTVYSKSDILDATVYAFTGAAYKLPGIEKVEMVDIFGDPVEKLPGEDRMGFLQSFRDDVSQRPWVKFLNERSIVFPSLQNTEVAWEDKDAIFGVKYENYDTKQFAYYAKKSGENFKKLLNGYTDENGDQVDGIMDVDSETQRMRDETIVEYNHKPVTLTEKLVREAMSAARSKARYQVKEEFATPTESPMTEGIGEGY